MRQAASFAVGGGDRPVKGEKSALPSATAMSQGGGPFQPPPPTGPLGPRHHNSPASKRTRAHLVLRHGALGSGALCLPPGSGLARRRATTAAIGPIAAAPCRVARVAQRSRQQLRQVGQTHRSPHLAGQLVGQAVRKQLPVVQRRHAAGEHVGVSHASVMLCMLGGGEGRGLRQGAWARAQGSQGGRQPCRTVKARQIVNTIQVVHWHHSLAADRRIWLLTHTMPVDCAVPQAVRHAVCVR